MSNPVTPRLVNFSCTPESQANELYSVLLSVLIEVMDFPPKKPSSTDSYLPPAVRDKILSVLEKFNPILEADLRQTGGIDHGVGMFLQNYQFNSSGPNSSNDNNGFLEEA